MNYKINEKYYDTPVESLGFTTRTINSLFKARINTLGELVETSEEELKEMPYLGDIRIAEIRDKLNELAADNIVEKVLPPQIEVPQELLEKPIDVLRFNVRPYNCLKRAGINTIGDLLSISDDDLLSIRNLGRSSLKEINDTKQMIFDGEISLEEIENYQNHDSDEEINIDDYPKKGFDRDLIRQLKEEFNFKYTWLTKWFDISRQAVDIKLKNKKNRGHWRDRELTDENIEDINTLVNSKSYLIDTDEKTVLFMNNKEDNCVLIFVDSEEIKCFFLEDLPQDIQDLILSEKMEFLTEQEREVYPGGKVFTVLKQSYFSPDNTAQYRRFASARGMNVEEYTMFMFGLPYVSHQNDITDERITNFLQENTFNGVTYIPSIPRNQWIRSFISRNGFTTDEFIEFYGFKSAATENAEEEIDYSDLFGKMDENMDVREPTGDYIEDIYAQYPLLGNKIISASNLQKIHDRAKKLIDERVINSNRKLSLKEEMIITLSVINYAKNWVGESKEKFTSFISTQYGYRDTDGLIRSIVNTCVNDAMVKNDRWFIVSQTGYQYKATIVAHALTPKGSWDAFFNFMFDFYTNNMNWEYVENDPIIERMIVALGAKFRSGDDDYDEDISISDKVYFFQEGIRKLLKYKPHYAVRVVSRMLQRIDAIINHTVQPPKDYIDVLADEWMQRRINSLSPDGRRNTTAGEKRNIALDYSKIHPLYQLKDNDTLLIVFPDVRMEESEFEKVTLDVKVGEQTVIKEKSLGFYGNELGKTLKGFSLDVEKDILRKADKTSFEISISVLCDNKQIYNSDTSLYRDYLCFKNATETSVEACKKGGYSFIWPTSGQLCFENAEESEIKHNELIYATYVQLNDAFIIKYDGKMVSMESSEGDGEVSIKIPAVRTDAAYIELGTRYEIVKPDAIANIIVSEDLDVDKLRVVVNGIDVQLSTLEFESVRNKKIFQYKLAMVENTERCNMQITNKENGKIVAKKNYIVIDKLNCHFNKKYYFDDEDYTDAAALIMINGKQNSKIVFNQDDRTVSAPYGHGSVEIRIPVIKIVDNYNYIWKSEKKFWLREFDQNLFLKCISTADVNLEITLNGEAIELESNSGYPLGNALMAYSVDAEDDAWIDLQLRVFSVNRELLQTYVIGKFSSKERFTRHPILRFDNNKLLWDLGYGFIGDPQSELHITVTREDEVVAQEQLKLDEEIIYEELSLEDGEYEYEIYKNSGNIFSSKKQVIADGTFFAGDENALRFSNKIIKLTSVTGESIKDGTPIVIPIRPSYIDNIVFDGIHYVFSEERECPVYSGVLYFITPNSHKRKEYSYTNGISEDGMALCKVNPVKIIYINDSTVNVTDEDGDGLIYQRMFNRTEMTNNYYITDWDPDAPKNRPYRDNYDAVDLFSYTTQKEQ